MIEPNRLIEHLDTLARPVTPAEIQHGERASRARLVATSAIAILVIVLVAVAWLGRDNTVDQQPAETPTPDVEVTPPTVPEIEVSEITFGPTPDFIPLTPPLDEWQLTAFRSGVDENQEIVPTSRYAAVNDTGDGYAATLRVTTATTGQFIGLPFTNSDEEFRLSDGRTAWRNDFGGTNVRVELDDRRSLVVQGQGLDGDEVLAALIGVEFVDDIPVVAASALPAGMQRLEGSTLGNRTTSTTWIRGERTIRLTQIDGPGAQLDWRRCCNLANRWPSDPGAVDDIRGSWTRQIDEQTVVSTRGSATEGDAREFLDSLTRPSAARWLVELESQLLGDLSEGRLLDPGPLSDRGNALVAAVGAKVIIWGGRFAGIDLTDGAIYDFDTGSWSPMAPHPAPPADASIAVLDDRVVVFGGTIEGEPTTAAAIYDPADDRWTTVAPFPTDGPITGALVRPDATLLVRASNGHGHLFATLDPDEAEWSVLPAPPAVAFAAESKPITISESARWLAYVGTVPYSEPNGGSARVQILDLETRSWRTHELPAARAAGNIEPGYVWIGDELVFASATSSKLRLADEQSTAHDALLFRPVINQATLDPATGAWTNGRSAELDVSCVSPSLRAEGDDLLIICQRFGTELRLRPGSGTWEVDNPDAATPRFVPLPDSLRDLANESAGPFAYLGGDGVPNTFVLRTGPDDN